MRIAVVGAGLIGLTSAWSLARRGHRVTVLDRNKGPALETSFANGALLTPSMSDPWNAPGSWRMLLASIGRADAAMQLRLKALPSIGSWGLGFLRNSTPERFARNTLSNLRLAQLSLRATERIRLDAGLDYGALKRGSLRLFRSEAALDKARVAAARLAQHGLSSRSLSPAELVSLEPALAPIASQLSGAIHYPDDQCGDAYRFCVGLSEALKAMGVAFRFGEEAEHVVDSARSLSYIRVGREIVDAECVVMAAGSATAALLHEAKLPLPVRPVKGYSLTYSDDLAKPPLGHPLVDDDLHAVIVPIDRGIRVAGTAEFAGFDRSLPPERIRNLEALAEQILPKARLDPRTARPWSGLRPVSVDGVPIISGTAIRNLFVNVGHGHLGWTMAAGSGELLAALVEQSRLPLDASPYSAARFGRWGVKPHAAVATRLEDRALALVGA